MQTEKQITKMINKASEIIESGQSASFGLSYEEGVKIALEWVLENTKELPLE